MNRKFLAPALLALILAAVVWSFWLLDRAGENRLPMRTSSSQMPADLQVSDADLARLERLDEGLVILGVRRHQRPLPDELVAVIAPRQQRSEQVTAHSPIERRHFDVSLVYVSDNVRRAVINGQYASVGDQLNGGGRIESISDEHIVIVDGAYRRTLKTPNARLNGR